MRKFTLALLMAALLLAMIVVPAFAIGNPFVPICDGNDNSNGKAGGDDPGGNAAGATSGNPSPVPPFPAKGAEHSPHCD